MRRKLFHFKAITIFIFLFSFISAKADKEASPFQLDWEDSTANNSFNTYSDFLPVLVFDSLQTTDLLPFTLPYTISYQKGPESRPLLDLEKKYDSLMIKNQIERRSVHYISITRPELIDFYDLHQFDNTLNYVQEEEKMIHVEGVEEPQLLPTPFILETPKRNKDNEPWKLNGDLFLQLSQYFVTDNWHKGGTPNTTLLSILKYDIDYKKNRWLLENDFDTKIGFYHTVEDSNHVIRINNDIFKINSRIGYQTSMTPKLYYSATIDFSTSFFKGYKKSNSNEVITYFLSPTRCFFGLGMDYRHNKNTAVKVYPLSYKIICLLPNSGIDPLSVGIDSFHCHKSYPGYMIQTELNWKFSKEIKITSDFDLFSSYNCRNIELDWETVGLFTINRFLSTRLSLIMRFDNTPLNEKAKVQIQEQLSFGFSYHFQ